MYWKRAYVRVQNTNCRLEDVSRLCDFDLHIVFICFDAETFSDCHIFGSPVGVAQNRRLAPFLWFWSRCNLWQSPIYIHVAIFMLAKGAINDKMMMLTNNANHWNHSNSAMISFRRLHWIDYWNLNCFPNWEIRKKNKLSGSYLPMLLSWQSNAMFLFILDIVENDWVFTCES